jgi:hypothetical protein
VCRTFGYVDGVVIMERRKGRTVPGISPSPPNDRETMRFDSLHSIAEPDSGKL